MSDRLNSPGQAYIVITKNTAYHFVGARCVRVTDRRTSAEKVGHRAVGQRLTGCAIGRDIDNLVNEPIVGGALWFVSGDKGHLSSTILQIQSDDLPFLAMENEDWLLRDTSTPAQAVLQQLVQEAMTLPEADADPTAVDESDPGFMDAAITRAPVTRDRRSPLPLRSPLAADYPTLQPMSSSAFDEDQLTPPVLTDAKLLRELRPDAADLREAHPELPARQERSGK